MQAFDFFESDEAERGDALLTAQSLIDTQERLGAMLDVMPIGLLIHTEQAILFANQEASALLGRATDTLRGQHFLDYVRTADAERVAAQLNTSFCEGITVESEAVLDRQDGSEAVIRLITGRLPWPGSAVCQVLFQDVTDQKRAEHSLRRLTITDELTGAYNRRHILYEASLYLDESSKTPVSLVLLDIDHFKDVNDRYGHAAGDQVLIALAELAQRFVPTLRDSDSAIFARIGGEEFALLLPGIRRERAAVIAERFRARIEQLVVATDAGRLRFTASMGVAARGARNETVDQLLAKADGALYASKGAGRNRVSVAD